MNTSLRTVLVALIGSLVAVGCDERSDYSSKSLPLSKVCELTTRGNALSEDECEDLCDDGDVVGCSVFPSAATCTDSSKTDSTLVPQALLCRTTHLEFENPFESKSVDGRRPEGFFPTTQVSDLGTLFAESYELEAASVDAFERLARELEAFGAPAALVERAHDAKRDEIRHARWTAVLARKHGVEPNTVKPAPLSVRNLFAMALENAVEGVVRETFGAARALYRATCIPDPRAQRVMRRIAQDELRHAELSWDVALFAAEHLDTSERLAIARAIEDELQCLERAVAKEEDPWLRRAGGLPSRQACMRIVNTLRELIDSAPFSVAA